MEIWMTAFRRDTIFWSTWLAPKLFFLTLKKAPNVLRREVAVVLFPLTKSMYFAHLCLCVQAQAYARKFIRIVVDFFFFFYCYLFWWKINWLMLSLPCVRTKNEWHFKFSLSSKRFCKYHCSHSIYHLDFVILFCFSSYFENVETY